MYCFLVIVLTYYLILPKTGSILPNCRFCSIENNNSCKNYTSKKHENEGEFSQNKQGNNESVQMVAPFSGIKVSQVKPFSEQAAKLKNCTPLYEGKF